MKALSYQEVVDRIKQFNEYLELERDLQEELLNLQLYGSTDLVRQNRSRHDEILAQIEEQRMRRMIPILQELAESVQEYRRLQSLGLLKRKPPEG